MDVVARLDAIDERLRVIEDRLAIQELRSGAPAIMFVALAIYGGAMLAIAKLRSAT